MSLPEVVRTYFETGELEREFFEINGKKEGVYKYYHKNGNIYLICNYINGELNGELISYYEKVLGLTSDESYNDLLEKYKKMKEMFNDTSYDEKTKKIKIKDYNIQSFFFVKILLLHFY